MSAIEPLGYPDWQRLTNWDGPVLWSPTGGVHNAQITSPVARVDRYQSIGGIIQLNGGKAHVGFAWTADQAQTTPLGERDFYLDGASNAYMQYRLVNQGAWVQAFIIPIGASFTLQAPATVAASNRAFPAELFGTVPFVLDIPLQNVAAGVTQTANVQPVLGGRGHLWGYGPFGGGFIGMQAMTAAGTYDKVIETAIDANGEVNLDVVMPQASVQVYWHNTTAGVAAYGATLTHAGGQ